MDLHAPQRHPDLAVALPVEAPDPAQVAADSQYQGVRLPSPGVLADELGNESVPTAPLAPVTETRIVFS